ncbi:Ig-like domain-containing protein [Clostridium sp. JS66]|uniref:Ig-like domain-containing protein n=1 Tax=Clostridium sp. JS66 TaxID=3064705 RepID=UPI00298D8BD7|nr:Ig-like domain-containing protein [Clostridium sp. JS66]WPC41007.1 hydrolase [Clostridium sp. JS66]
MKKIMKRVVLVLSFVMICYVSYGALSVSAAEDFNDMGNRAISDVNKVWTLKFRTPVDISSLNNSIRVEDLTDGSAVSVSISAGEDENSAKVNPPSVGYKVAHSYKLTIDKNVKSKKGENLPRSAVLEFNLTSKDNNNYNVLSNVEVASGFSMIKKITIVDTNLPSVSKCKIEGSNNFFDVGKTVGLFTAQNTVKVYLYDNKENLLGTSILNVDSTQNNINIKVTLAN